MSTIWSKHYLKILDCRDGCLADGIWVLIALGKAECVPYKRNDEKVIGDQKRLTGH